MIPQELWAQHGVWGDETTPDAAEVFVPIVGSWTSALVDLTEGVEQVGGFVAHAFLDWQGGQFEGSDALLDVLVNDSGEWQEGLTPGDGITRCLEWNVVANPSVRLRVRIVSSIGDLGQHPEAALEGLTLRLLSYVPMRREKSPHVTPDWVRVEGS